MARVIVLDSGPLGLACDRPDKPEVLRISSWLSMVGVESLLVIPEIADYEVRRELLRINSVASLKRLDNLRRDLLFKRISEDAMRTAAALWADVRRQGVTTASNKALDGDAIVAAQAMDCAGLQDLLIVATDNVEHLARFRDKPRSQYLDARNWRAITV